MTYDEADLAYNGQVDLIQNKKTSITLRSEMILPER